MTTKQTLYVKGMHCSACEIVIEKSLKKIKDIKNVKANLSSETVSFDLVDTTLEDKFTELNDSVKELGYALHKNMPKNKVIWHEIIKAFTISLVFLAAFVAIQKLGIINAVNADSISLPFIMLIGVVASLSTCMAVVGGIVLSLSSAYVKSDKKNGGKALVTFHISRVVSFFILGGIIGLIGTAFTLSPFLTFFLNVFMFFVMVVLGINLLEILPLFKKLQFRMPKVLNFTEHERIKDSTYAPILLGAATFFLPCGFTQSMQFYSLTTGSFLNGALTMFFFSLGTLPILAAISLFSVKFSRGLQSKLFFKTAGFIIIYFAFFNLIGALTAIGILPPLINL